jgi:hypothetical protein
MTRVHRKSTAAEAAAPSSWLDLDAVASMTIVAGGRRMTRTAGAWSADCPGEQLIEVRFRQPVLVRRVRVVTCETAQSRRTEEMTVWASFHRGERHREVLRQQFTFGRDGAMERVEDYTLDLEEVDAIQVRIVPDIDGRPAVARVTELAVASTANTAHAGGQHDV